MVRVFSPIVSSSFRPCVSSPKPSGSPGRGVRHLPAGRLQRAAIDAPFLGRQAQQQRRAAAAARRICGTIVGVVRLPKVPMSKGT